MKKVILIVIVAAAAIAGLVVAYKQTSQERAAEAEGEAPVVAESRVRRSVDGEVTITLEAEAQQRVALHIAPPAPGTLPREVKAYGRVLDAAPLAALLAEIGTARATLEASQKERQRVNLLHGQGENASQRAVEAAETAVQRDQIAFEATQWKLVAAWGQALADHPDLPGLVKSLVTQQAALVRLDLPAGQTSATPRGARLFVLAAPDQPIEAQWIGPAADVNSQAQGQGFLFLAQVAGSGLRPGQVLLGSLQQPGEPLAGVLVPPSAVVRLAGKAWVYLQANGTNFTRRVVALDHPASGGWLVTTGLSPQDRLVVTGAQMLYSEELKSRIQIGD